MEAAFRQLFEKDSFPIATIRQNHEFVKQFDYEEIIQHHLIPVFRELTSASIKLSDNSIQKLSDNGQWGENKKKGVNGKRPLKIVFLCNTLALGKGGAERVAMDTANEMGKRGHLVYIAYHDKGFPAYQRDRGVVLLPFDSLETLSGKVRELNPDLFFTFYFNRMLVDFYSVIHQTGIPFGIQECTNPDRLLHNNWIPNHISFPKRCWEREVIASAAQRIRLTMSGYRKSFPHIFNQAFALFPNPSFMQKTIAEPGMPVLRKR
ncbi:MAG: hypothetical protein R2874_12320 [Desulfobacterales bacterium]